MYKIFIDGWQVPVAPEKLNLRLPNKNKQLSLINEGEINLLKTPGLKTVSFELLLPSRPYHFATGHKAPEEILSMLEALKVKKRVFRLIISRIKEGKVRWDTSLSVSLEELEQVEAWEENQDLLISLAFREYRTYSNQAATQHLGGLALLSPPRQRWRMGADCGSAPT